MFRIIANGSFGDVFEDHESALNALRELRREGVIAFITFA
jgi:hypothetical protein